MLLAVALHDIDHRPVFLFGHFFQFLQNRFFGMILFGLIDQILLAYRKINTFQILCYIGGRTAAYS